MLVILLHYSFSNVLFMSHVNTILHSLWTMFSCDKTFNSIYPKGNASPRTKRLQISFCIYILHKQGTCPTDILRAGMWAAGCVTLSFVKWKAPIGKVCNNLLFFRPPHILSLTIYSRSLFDFFLSYKCPFSFKKSKFVIISTFQCGKRVGIYKAQGSITSCNYSLSFYLVYLLSPPSPSPSPLSSVTPSSLHIHTPVILIY